jgi:uncharacterized protein (TIGR03083 family)
VGHAEDCNVLDIEIRRFANVMSSVPSDLEVATCPGWNVRDLAEHLGVIHRWAEELVRLRSSVRLAREVTDETSAAVSPEWIRDGGRQLVATLRAANPDDQMWAWGLDQHVRFWSRRQLHETLVHRMDLELAANIEPRAEPAIAADAIDEYLSNLTKVAKQSPDLSQLRGDGEQLAFRVRDGGGLWSITLGEDGVGLSKEEAVFATELVGSSLDVLLVILRRREVNRSRVEVIGDRKLLDFWLEHSAFD